MLPFLLNFYGLLFGWALLLFWPNMKLVALTIPDITVGWSFGWGVNPNTGEGEAFFLPHFLSPQNSLCSPGSRWMAFGARRVNVKR